MKRVSLRKHAAPTPRMTLWVPALASTLLSLLWLAGLALVQR